MEPGVVDLGHGHLQWHLLVSWETGVERQGEELVAGGGGEDGVEDLEVRVAELNFVNWLEKVWHIPIQRDADLRASGSDVGEQGIHYQKKGNKKKK